MRRRCTDIGAKINGLMVSHNGGICLKTAQGPCTITFAAGGVIFRVRYHGAKADDFVWTVLRSLTELPSGFTTVPFFGYGSSVEDAKAVLAKAGLSGESPEVNWPHYATGTDPEAGSVVPEGATVELSIGDG